MASWIVRTKYCTQPAVGNMGSWSWTKFLGSIWAVWSVLGLLSPRVGTIFTVSGALQMAVSQWSPQVERFLGSRCRWKGAGPSSSTDHCGLTGYRSTDFKATVSGQTHGGDLKLAPCGVSWWRSQIGILWSELSDSTRQYFWFSKELNNLKCTRQKVRLRRSVGLSRLGDQLSTLDL